MGDAADQTNVTAAKTEDPSSTQTLMEETEPKRERTTVKQELDGLDAGDHGLCAALDRRSGGKVLNARERKNKRQLFYIRCSL